MKKVVAFSLWGNQPKYNIGAINNAILRKEIYPDWISVFFLGQSVPSITIKSLKEIPDTEIVIMDSAGDWTGMFWRFLPSFDPNVDIMISRDADSRLSNREKAAVDEWLSSNKDFHIMRDHPYHNTQILGGMWGVRNHLFDTLDIDMASYEKGNFWQTDQNFLRNHVYNKVVDHSFVHDSYCGFENFSKQFPSTRINQQFVGEIYDEFNNRHPDHYTLIT